MSVSFTYSILKRNILFFNLFILLTAFSPLVGDRNENFLFIGVMIFSVIITSGHLLRPHKKDLIIYLLLISLLISAYYNLNAFRISSYLYAVLFILFFISNLSLLRNAKIQIGNYQNFLKVIIYCYFVVLIIQQVMYLFGIDNFFNIMASEQWKFNVLHTEPSYAATVIGLLFYSFIYIRKIQNNFIYRFSDINKDKVLWLIYSYIMITIGSSYGILFFILFFLSFIKNFKFLIFCFILIFSLYMFGLSYDFEPLLRLNKILISIIQSSADYSSIVEADHSASIRILPLLISISEFKFFKLFGMGMDFSTNYFPTVIPGINEGSYFGGLIPTFIIDNGLLSTLILFLIIKKKVINSFFSYVFVLFCFISLNASFNSQLFWSVMTILAVNFYYKTQFVDSN